MGFEYDKSSRTWQKTTWDAEQNFVIRQPQKQQSWAWEVAELGRDVTTAECGEFLQDRWLNCGAFSFDKQVLRFVYSSTSSYFRSDAELQKLPKPDSLFMTIGRCTTI
ncbi:MAG: hypothetical protein WD647_10905 [Steroidobacteraceae bacterium]